MPATDTNLIGGEHVLVGPHLLARRHGIVFRQHGAELLEERSRGLDVGVDEADQLAVVADTANRIDGDTVGNHHVG